MGQPMTTPSITKGVPTMEILIFLGVFAAWIILQAWVLPKFGVRT